MARVQVGYRTGWPLTDVLLTKLICWLDGGCGREEAFRSHFSTVGHAGSSGRSWRNSPARPPLSGGRTSLTHEGFQRPLLATLPALESFGQRADFAGAGKPVIDDLMVAPHHVGQGTVGDTGPASMSWH
jgi:hypothetical protein